MGVAEIVSHIKDGRYKVKPKPNLDRAKELKLRYEADINELEQAITQRNIEIADINAKLAILSSEIDIAIGMGATLKQIAEYHARMIPLIDQRILLRSENALDTAKKTVRQKFIAAYNRLEAPAEKELWCADYSLDLAVGREIDTIEINDDAMSPNGLAVIAPGGTLTTRRRVQPSLSSGPEAVFFNWAILPGAQRHKPQYRIGVIDKIKSGDLCDLNLEHAASSQQRLNINQLGTFFDVPIKYMNCNSEAFKSGDRVVVAFAGDWKTPKVVGFVDHPVPCIGMSAWVSYSEAQAKLKKIKPDGTLEEIADWTYRYDASWIGGVERIVAHCRGVADGHGICTWLVLRYDVQQHEPYAHVDHHQRIVRLSEKTGATEVLRIDSASNLPGTDVLVDIAAQAGKLYLLYEPANDAVSDRCLVTIVDAATMANIDQVSFWQHNDGVHAHSVTALTVSSKWIVVSGIYFDSVWTRVAGIVFTPTLGVAADYVLPGDWNDFSPVSSVVGDKIYCFDAGDMQTEWQGFSDVIYLVCISAATGQILYRAKMAVPDWHFPEGFFASPNFLAICWTHIVYPPTEPGFDNSYVVGYDADESAFGYKLTAEKFKAHLGEPRVISFG